MNYIFELKGFEAIESDGRGCEGCAFNGMPLCDSGGRSTNCGKVACFSEDFPEGHPMHLSRNPIVWVRKGGSEC